MAKELLEAIDADEAQKIVMQVLDFAGEIAAMTPWPTDDKVVAVAKDLVNRPLVWKILIGLINRALPEGTEGQDAELLAAVAAEAPKGIDPVTVVTLITTLLPLIQKAIAFWKQRRNQAAPAPSPDVV